MNINIKFSQLLLKDVLKEIKVLTTTRERRESWVYHLDRDHWEFHGPDRYYWHGRADNAYEARAKGWQAWREQLKHDHENSVTRIKGEKQRQNNVDRAI